jgi:hypothetical protein
LNQNLTIIRFRQLAPFVFFIELTALLKSFLSLLFLLLKEMSKTLNIKCQHTDGCVSQEAPFVWTDIETMVLKDSDGRF